MGSRNTYAPTLGWTASARWPLVWVDAAKAHHAPKGVEQRAVKAAEAAREAAPVQTLQARRVHRLTELTIGKRGQQILLPEHVLEG